MDKPCYLPGFNSDSFLFESYSDLNVTIVPEKDLDVLDAFRPTDAENSTKLVNETSEPEVQSTLNATVIGLNDRESDKEDSLILKCKLRNLPDRNQVSFI